jgi:hypothetical protein
MEGGWRGDLYGENKKWGYKNGEDKKIQWNVLKRRGTGRSTCMPVFLKKKKKKKVLR